MDEELESYVTKLLATDATPISALEEALAFTAVGLSSNGRAMECKLRIRLYHLFLDARKPFQAEYHLSRAMLCCIGQGIKYSSMWGDKMAHLARMQLAWNRGNGLTDDIVGLKNDYVTCSTLMERGVSALCVIRDLDAAEDSFTRAFDCFSRVRHKDIFIFHAEVYLCNAYMVACQVLRYQSRRRGGGDGDEDIDPDEREGLEEDVKQTFAMAHRTLREVKLSLMSSLTDRWPTILEGCLAICAEFEKDGKADPVILNTPLYAHLNMPVVVA